MHAMLETLHWILPFLSDFHLLEMTFFDFSWCNKDSPQILKDLYAVIMKKKSVLCVAVDVTSCQELLQLADQVGPYICLLKVSYCHYCGFMLQYFLS